MADVAQAEVRLLSVKDVARLLNCSVRHVWRLADSGRMPAPRRLGGICRWDRHELETWLANGCPPLRTAKGTSEAER